MTQPEACGQLGKLLTSHGSDKATVHDYYKVYWALLRDRQHDPIQLLEIGLGTNNIDVPSNMGRLGRPGASLRAFRDYFPRVVLYGADVDRRVLFSEERISTFFIDQTSVEVLSEAAAHLGPNRFDLIIDDGLHNSEANLNTVHFALPLLRPCGVLVIEDIAEADLPYYQIVNSMLRGLFQMRLLRTKSAYMCLILRRQ